MDLLILNYNLEYEKNWLECLKEAFYSSPYYDTLLQVKPRYENPSIELIALDQTELIGFLDIEIVPQEEQFCFNDEENVECGQLSLIGVHPDYRRRGAATKLLKTAIKRLCNEYQINRLEIFFREDPMILSWVESVGFQECANFYEITLTDDFFEKYDIELPFGINPSLLIGFVDQDGYRMLSNRHPPEKTYPILIYKKDW